MVILKATDLAVKLGTRSIINPVSFTINNNEHWAIVGPSGSGKTTLLHTLAGMQFHSGHLEIEPGMKIISVQQQHRFKNLSNTSTFYYQQRFNSYDSEDTFTVKEYLDPYISINTDGDKFLHLLDIDKIGNRKLIQLSNGENKRLQIAKALLQHPNILLLDNPFIGLDVDARQILEQLLHSITQHDIHIITVTSSQWMPSFITNILALDGEGGAKVYTAHAFKAIEHEWKQHSQLDVGLLKELTTVPDKHEFDDAIRMKNVRIHYGDKAILKNVTWQVKEGERWALSGPNGAGKSTLLSLVTGDNPQAYANEIYLFDKRRGSGESIWDIKRRIGYVSPELHLYFPSSVSVFSSIASGLFDTIGLFRKLNEVQMKRVSGWIDLFDLSQNRNRLLSQLSTSEQRLTLLARALIKNPSLLILDEPVQGLDADQAAAFKDLVDQVCTFTNKTLVYVSNFQEEIPCCVHHYIRLAEGKVVEIKQETINVV